MIGMFVYGVVNSCMLVLMAIGFSLTFGISGIANFAYGALYITGAYLCWHFLNSFGLFYPVSIVLSALITGLVGICIYRFFLFRVRGIPLSEIIVTFGLGTGMLELYRSMGLTGHSYKLPPFVDGSWTFLMCTSITSALLSQAWVFFCSSFYGCLLIILKSA